MSTIEQVKAVSKKVYCKKLTITGELDNITDSSQIKMVAILDNHLIDEDGNDIGNEGTSKAIRINISNEDLANHLDFITLIGAKIDEVLAPVVLDKTDEVLAPEEVIVSEGGE